MKEAFLKLLSYFPVGKLKKPLLSEAEGGAAAESETF